MKTLIVLLLIFTPALYADQPVATKMTNVLGQVVSSVPGENTCTAAKGIYKGERNGCHYWTVYCNSGKSYMVRTLAGSTKTQVADCAQVALVGGDCDAVWE